MSFVCPTHSRLTGSLQRRFTRHSRVDHTSRQRERIWRQPPGWCLSVRCPSAPSKPPCSHSQTHCVIRASSRHWAQWERALVIHSAAASGMAAAMNGDTVYRAGRWPISRPGRLQTAPFPTVACSITTAATGSAFAWRISSLSLSRRTSSGDDGPIGSGSPSVRRGTPLGMLWLLHRGGGCAGHAIKKMHESQ
jgi:hypothetical protein